MISPCSMTCLHEGVCCHHIGNWWETWQQVVGIDCIIRWRWKRRRLNVRLSLHLLLYRFKGPTPERLLTHQSSKRRAFHPTFWARSGKWHWGRSRLWSCCWSPIEPDRAGARCIWNASLHDQLIIYYMYMLLYKIWGWSFSNYEKRNRRDQRKGSTCSQDS